MAMEKLLIKPRTRIFMKANLKIIASTDGGSINFFKANSNLINTKAMEYIKISLCLNQILSQHSTRGILEMEIFKVKGYCLKTAEFPHQN
jgi:hypothetical protein